MQSEETMERRQREQSAPKLCATVPRLAGLMIEVQEYSQIACVKYKKRFHVASAPTLFELRCNDDRCDHGGYDLTHAVLRALRNGETRAKGDCTCDGTTGTASCSRRIQFEVFAEYVSA